MGCWVLLTPWAYGRLGADDAAFWSAIGTGSLVLLTALAKALRPDARRLSWITLLAGGWSMVSSVVLSPPSRAATDAAVVGLFIVLASLASTAGTSLALDGRPETARHAARARHPRRAGRHVAI
jgi:hypothetical protein